MFGIGKVLQNVLNEHNIGGLVGELATGSMADLRQSIEALGDAGKIADVGRLLEDLSGQLNASFGEAAEEASHLANPADEDTPASATLDAQAATGGAVFGTPVEAEIIPHEAVHTLQGIAVEDDAVIATEAEAPAATAETMHAEEAGETADD